MMIKSSCSEGNPLLDPSRSNYMTPGSMILATINGIKKIHPLLRKTVTATLWRHFAMMIRSYYSKAEKAACWEHGFTI